MNEEWLRAWARDHETLVDIVIATVVILAVAIRAVRWLRHNDVHEALDKLVKPASPVAADPAVPAAPPLTPRARRVGSSILAVLGVIAIALAVTSCWAEYDWLGAEVVRAPFVDASTGGGTVTARYRVAPAARPPFTATFSYTPRGGSTTGVDEAMRITRVVEIHRGDPLRYREYARSTSRDLRGWPLIEFDGALGACFGGVFLLFAFKLRP